MIITLLSELIWFLLPVAAFSGWYVGTHKKEAKAEWKPTPEYIQGLNSFLSQGKFRSESTEAIDALINFFEVTPATVETHIILGNLFRAKGEVEKATKIHQNIVSQNDISSETRVLALSELGRDYRHAGLLDSAEEVFKNIAECDSRTLVRSAHRNLVDIYEQEKQWDKAIESVRYLINEGLDEYTSRTAHYQNEIAEECLVKKDYAGARHHNDLAKQSGSMLRTVVTQADIEFSHGNYPTALHLYSTALMEWPTYAQFILPKLRSCFPDPSGFADHLISVKPSVMTASYIMAYTKSLLEAHRVREAQEFALAMIESGRTSISMLKLFVEHRVGDMEAKRNGGLMPHLAEALKLHEDDTGYACSECGLKVVQLYWQCPRCHAWDLAEALDVIEPAKTEILSN